MTDPGGNNDLTAAPDIFQPLGFGNILERVFKICWQNARSFLIVVGLLVVPPNVLFVLAFLQLPPELLQQTQSDPFASTTPEFGFNPAELVVPGALILVSIVLAIIGWAAAAGAGCFIAESAHAGAPTDWRASLKVGGRRLLSVMWITILTGLLLLVVFGVIFAPGLVAVIAVQDVSSILLVILMFILGLGSMLSLYVFIAPAPAVAVTEGIGGSKALRRSYRLVKGNFFWIAAVLFVMLAAGWFIGSIFTGPASVMSFTGAGNPTMNLSVSMVANVLSMFVTLPLQVTVLALLYVDARVRKENLTPQLLRDELQNSLR